MGTSWNTEAIKLYAYQLGKRIAKQRLFQVMGDYTHCLFNGKKLWKLPYWDTDEFPYVCLSGTGFFLSMYCFSEPHHNIIEYNGTNPCVGVEAGETYLESRIMYVDITNTQLPTPEEITATAQNRFFQADVYNSDTILWANYDILDKDGNVVLAASEPIPVYE